jgi:hypothetical protein
MKTPCSPSAASQAEYLSRFCRRCGLRPHLFGHTRHLRYHLGIGLCQDPFLNMDTIFKSHPYMPACSNCCRTYGVDVQAHDANRPCGVLGGQILQKDQIIDGCLYPTPEPRVQTESVAAVSAHQGTEVLGHY